MVCVCGGRVVPVLLVCYRLPLMLLRGHIIPIRLPAGLRAVAIIHRRAIWCGVTVAGRGLVVDIIVIHTDAWEGGVFLAHVMMAAL